MTVIVKEAATGEPISQARVTLQFTVPRGMVWEGEEICLQCQD